MLKYEEEGASEKSEAELGIARRLVAFDLKRRHASGLELYASSFRLYDMAADATRGDNGTTQQLGPTAAS